MLVVILGRIITQEDGDVEKGLEKKNRKNSLVHKSFHMRSADRDEFLKKQEFERTQLMSKGEFERPKRYLEKKR